MIPLPEISVNVDRSAFTHNHIIPRNEIETENRKETHSGGRHFCSLRLPPPTPPDNVQREWVSSHKIILFRKHAINHHQTKKTSKCAMYRKPKHAYIDQEQKRLFFCDHHPTKKSLQHVTWCVYTTLVPRYGCSKKFLRLLVT